MMKKRLMALALALCLVLLCACGAKAEKSSDLNALKADILSHMDPDDVMELNADDILELYGIQVADVKQCVALIAKESLNSDEVLLFEAVDDAAAKRILEKLNNRYQAKLNETKDYLPDEYTKISACKVEQSGRYIAMIVSADAEELNKLYKDSFK